MIDDVLHLHLNGWWHHQESLGQCHDCGRDTIWLYLDEGFYCWNHQCHEPEHACLGVLP